jgi:hypothetical protein
MWIAEPHQGLRRLSTHVGIDASPAVLERMVAAGRTEGGLTRAHRTTDDGPRSVGRHRYDMNEEMRGPCLEVGADLLTELATEDGQEISAGRPLRGHAGGQA